jgi:hypothetical protein
MVALRLELGIVTIMTAGLLVFRPGPVAPSAPGMPDPSEESLPLPVAQTASVSCNDIEVKTIVVKGRVTALADDSTATFHIRFGGMLDRYAVATNGPEGEFELRVAREELGDVTLDLCDLPMQGRRPSATFRDDQMMVEYEILFEK